MVTDDSGEATGNNNLSFLSLSFLSFLSRFYCWVQGKVREGSATFWRTSRFSRALTLDILMRDLFKQVSVCVEVCACVFVCACVCVCV